MSALAQRLSLNRPDSILHVHHFMSKIILVTGASSGIGQSIAETLCAQGHTVYGLCRSHPDDTIIHHVRFLQVDVRSEEMVTYAFQKVISRSGRIDVVINCAGILLTAPAETTTMSDAQQIMDTNFFGVVSVCRNASKIMRENGGGYIINVSAISGLISTPFQSIYSASKKAVEGYTEALSMELTPFNIKVVLVEPGNHSSQLLKNALQPAHITDDIYGQVMDSLHYRFSRLQKQAMSPQIIGHLVAGIVLNPKPRLRYSSGKLFHRLTLLCAWILPSRLVERMLLRYYGLPRKHSKKNPML
jgi:NAD(P)-dependent dehydrogenase (short-subunit alcohol dehydrogenase family)